MSCDIVNTVRHEIAGNMGDVADYWRSSQVSCHSVFHPQSCYLTVTHCLFCTPVPLSLFTYTRVPRGERKCFIVTFTWEADLIDFEDDKLNIINTKILIS